MNTNKLSQMLNSTFQPALEEGIYDVVMKSYELVHNDRANVDYVVFKYDIPTLNREISENRFEKGLGVMVSHIRQQLGKEDEAVIPKELFDSLITNKTPLKLWVVKRIVGGIQRTNFNFLEPIKEDKPNLNVVEDTDENKN